MTAIGYDDGREFPAGPVESISLSGGVFTVRHAGVRCPHRGTIDRARFTSGRYTGAMAVEPQYVKAGWFYHLTITLDFNPQERPPGPIRRRGFRERLSSWVWDR
jgi:hypothetical protein